MHARKEGDLLLRLALAEHVGVDGPRGDGVHGDLACTEILGERAADLLDRTLGGDVEHVVGRDRGRGGKRGREEDDAPT